MTKEALKLALEALRMPSNYWNKTQFIKVKEAIKASEEALAQPTSGDYALGYAEGFNDACKPKPAPVQEPCGWQFYQDGKWHNGMETNNHRANTEAAGVPVRDVYPTPPAAQLPPNCGTGYCSCIECFKLVK
jgi:hypothetical protein